MAVLFHMSGINFIATYATQLSNQIATGEFSLVLPSIINFVEAPALFVAFVLNHHFGRKSILLFGTTVAFLANLIISIGFYIFKASSAGTVLLYIGIFMFIINFGLTLGPVIFIYIS